MEKETAGSGSANNNAETKNTYRSAVIIFGMVGAIVLLVVAGVFSLEHYKQRHYRDYQVMLALQKLAEAEASLENHLVTYPRDHRARYELIKILYGRGEAKRADGIAAILMGQNLELQLQYDLPNYVWGQKEREIIAVHERVKEFVFEDNLDHESLLGALGQIQKDIDLLAVAGNLLTKYWEEFDLSSDRNQEALQHIKGQEAIKSFIRLRVNGSGFENNQHMNCGAIFGGPFGGSPDFNLVSLMGDYADRNTEDNRYAVASQLYQLSRDLIEKNLVCFDSPIEKVDSIGRAGYLSLAKEFQFKYAVSEYKAKRFAAAVAILRKLNEEGYEVEKVSNLIQESITASAREHLNRLRQRADKAFSGRDWQGALATYQEMRKFAQQQKNPIFEKYEARALYDMAMCYGNAADDVKKRQVLRQLQRHFPEWEPELVSARLSR